MKKHNEKSQNNKLSTRQIRCLEFLLSGMSITATAREMGAERETISRWLNHDETFQAEYERLRNETHRAVTARIMALADTALDKLEAILNDDKTPPHLQLKAIAQVLKFYEPMPEPEADDKPPALPPMDPETCQAFNALLENLNETMRNMEENGYELDG